MRWEFRSYAELSKDELLALLKLRTDVFVVEQACACLLYTSPSPRDRG